MSKPKTALVLGGAECVWQDAERALAMFTPDGVIAVNDMIAAWPNKITHACTLHGEKLLDWQQARKAAKFNADYQTIYFERMKGKPAPKIDHVIEYRWPHLDSGSSGLYAVKALLDLGFDRIVLAGVPMTQGGGHFLRQEPWDAHNRFRGAWVGAIPHIAGKVKSMSGWTQEILGSPSPEWLTQ